MKYLAVFCSVFALAIAQPSWATIILKDAYSFPTLSGTTTGAAYVTISNKSGETLHIVSADSPLAEHVELHDHQMTENGLMKMVRKKRVSIAAGETIIFQPGGMHIMLMQMNKTIREGEIIPLSITLDDGRVLQFNATAIKR